MRTAAARARAYKDIEIALVTQDWLTAIRITALDVCENT